MTHESFACRACANTRGHRVHVAREMMFGTREAFEYVECGECGCLQIGVIPENLADHYPAEYGSFRAASERPSRLQRLLRRLRARYCLGDRGLPARTAWSMLGSLQSSIWGSPDPYVWLRHCNADLASRILDVGCGSGALLLELRDEGFADLTGADPMLPASIDHGDGLIVHDRDLADMPGQFDLVMMHHSFEHVPDPRATLAALRDHLLPRGHAVLRTPVVPCLAWTTYGTDWLQLDAPRHLNIQSPASLERLAAAEGLRVDAVEWDSFAAQFWGSEQYRADIPLMDPRSYLVAPDRASFTAQQLEEWERRSLELNARREGDQACFYLSRR